MRLFQHVRLLSPGDGDAPNTAAPKVDPPQAEAPKVDPKPDPTAAELEELRKFKAERTAADTKAAQTKAAAEQAEALKRGEYDKVIAEQKAELERTKAELARHETESAARTKALDARNAERLKALPDSLKKLAPTKLPAADLAEWLDNAGAAGASVAEPAPVVPAGAAPRVGSSAIPQEIVDEAKKKNIKPEDWAELVKEHQPDRWAKLTKVK